MRKLLALVVLALGAGGLYVWWRRRADAGRPDDRRVRTRSSLTVEESAVGSDDPVAQAAAILAESDARGAVSRDEPGVERRRSEDTVGP